MTIFLQSWKPHPHPFTRTFILDRSPLLIVTGDFEIMLVNDCSHCEGSRASVGTSRPAKVFLQPTEPVRPVFKLATGILNLFCPVFNLGSWIFHWKDLFYLFPIALYLRRVYNTYILFPLIPQGPVSCGHFLYRLYRLYLPYP